MQIDHLIPFGFYRRLNPRERVLLLLVAGTAFLLGNLIALSTVVRAFHDLRRDYAQKNNLWNFSRHFIQDKAVWDARVEWLHKTQPRLTNRDSAGYELLNQLQGLGRQYQIIITNSHIRQALPGSENTSPDYQAVTMEFDTRSDWKAVVHFMEAVQGKPENFLAFDEARLHSEQSDPTTIIGNFRLSKWYAPNGK